MAHLQSILFIISTLLLFASCKQEDESFQVDIEKGFPIRIDFGVIDSIPFAYSVHTGKPYHALFHHIRITNVSLDSVYIPLKLWWNRREKGDPNYSYGLGHHSLLYNSLYFEGTGPVCIWDHPDSLYLLPPKKQFQTKLSPWLTVSKLMPEKNRTIADSLQLVFHLYELDSTLKFPMRESERLEMVFRGTESAYVCTKASTTSKE